MARKYTRGSVLITALFIVALVAIAATAMSIRLQQDIQRSRLTLTADRLYIASTEVIFWAMGVLSQPPENAPVLTHLEYPEAHQHDYPDVTISGQLDDLQGHFNLNQLSQIPGPKADEQQRQAQLLFYRLMKNILDTPESRAESSAIGSIVQATTRWVSELDLGRGQDELDNYYLKQHPPYSASHQLMQSMSEFRLVRGVTAPIYQALSPYLTALPPPTAINLNTAPLPVLMALGDGLDASDANMIIQARGQTGLTSLQPLTELITKAHIPEQQITLESEYFLCVSSARSHDQQLMHYTILHRGKDVNGKRITTIVHDSINDL
jgi:general secretion pathway protein K